MELLHNYYLIFFLIIHEIDGRSKGIKKYDICEDVPSDTLKIFEDLNVCGKFIACIGRTMVHYHCLNNAVYGNGISDCLMCNQNNVLHSNQTVSNEPKKGIKASKVRKRKSRQITAENQFEKSDVNENPEPANFLRNDSINDTQNDNFQDSTTYDVVKNLQIENNSIDEEEEKNKIFGKSQDDSKFNDARKIKAKSEPVIILKNNNSKTAMNVPNLNFRGADNNIQSRKFDYKPVNDNSYEKNLSEFDEKDVSDNEILMNEKNYHGDMLTHKYQRNENKKKSTSKENLSGEEKTLAKETIKSKIKIKITTEMNPEYTSESTLRVDNQISNSDSSSNSNKRSTKSFDNKRLNERNSIIIDKKLNSNARNDFDDASENTDRKTSNKNYFRQFSNNFYKEESQRNMISGLKPNDKNEISIKNAIKIKENQSKPLTTVFKNYLNNYVETTYKFEETNNLNLIQNTNDDETKKFSEHTGEIEDFNPRKDPKLLDLIYDENDSTCFIFSENEAIHDTTIAMNTSTTTVKTTEIPIKHSENQNFVNSDESSSTSQNHRMNSFKEQSIKFSYNSQSSRENENLNKASKEDNSSSASHNMRKPHMHQDKSLEERNSMNQHKFSEFFERKTTTQTTRIRKVRKSRIRTKSTTGIFSNNQE